MAVGVKWKSGGNGKLLAKLKKIGKGAKKAKLTAGFYKDAKYEDGTPVAQVAAANNFGTLDSGGFIPPRPFFNNAINENKDKWAEDYSKALKKTDYDIERSAKLVGEEMRADIIKKIDKGSYAPNAESTKHYKATAPGTHNQDPLKDTRYMMANVAYSYNDNQEQYDEALKASVAKQIEYNKKQRAKQIERRKKRK